MSAVSAFAGERKEFDIGPLAVSCIARQEADSFIALTNPHFSPERHALETDRLTRFEPFRTRLSAEEIARRQPDRLSDRQKQHLADYGYPFVRDEYKFHITLTNVVQAPEMLADLPADRMAQEIGTIRFRVDALYLFEQTDPGARFRVAGRFPFAA